jgi:membrane fusion protein (multidrug efflux system)
MRRNMVVAMVAVAALGLIVWAATRPNTPQPARILTAETTVPGKTVEKSGRDKSGKGGGRAIAVEAAIARGATTTTDIRAIGSLRSDESVQITTETAGRIADANFLEGGFVNAGDILVKLDDSLAQAEVADAKARYDLAEANNDRAKQLSRTGNVTEKAIDEAAANFEIARAAYELQRVRLSKHVIAAPFAGRVGLRKVSPGGFVAVGTAIVNIEKIDFLKVDFKLPELFLPSVSVGQTVDVVVDAVPDKTFVGEIYAIDPQVDVNGRALALRARLPNPDLALRPGLFARVLVKGKQTREVVLAPESAIVPRGGETFVYRIDNGKAMEAKVKLGERRGAEVEIVEGVMPNTQVVTAGQLKLRNGTPVEIIESQPEPDAGKAADRTNGAREPAPATKNGKGTPAPAAKKDGT